MQSTTKGSCGVIDGISFSSDDHSSSVETLEMYRYVLAFIFLLKTFKFSLKKICWKPWKFEKMFSTWISNHKIEYFFLQGTKNKFSLHFLVYMDIAQCSSPSACNQQTCLTVKNSIPTANITDCDVKCCNDDLCNVIEAKVCSLVHYSKILQKNAYVFNIYSGYSW